MEILCAGVYDVGGISCVQSLGSPPNPVIRLEYGDRMTLPGKICGGAETGDARTDYYDFQPAATFKW
jgi:hypothetical protein